ncbi:MULTISPECIES: EamA family transporter [Paenibacillus]|uniref:Membrane protein n=1 Tax=Paenibacillus naphthalenovorans TaxID=162209 RepID=A0A0U2INI3_9BACL|nr:MULTISPECIES: EamA family transporter [Paenibacillus]ALS24683.1 membrane protein [Paenibacillus naphthalenovorans]
MSYLWLVFALLSAITAALVSIFGKIGLQSVEANTATAVRAVIMAVFLVAVVAFQGNIGKIPSLFEDKKTLLFIVLSGAAGAASWLFYFWALKLGKVSQVAPVDKLSVVIATIAAVVFLGERLSWISGIGISLIAIGVILIAFS